MKVRWDGEVSVIMILAQDNDDAVRGIHPLGNIPDEKFAEAIKNVLIEHGVKEGDIHYCDTQFVEGEHGEPV